MPVVIAVPTLKIQTALLSPPPSSVKEPVTPTALLKQETPGASVLPPRS